MRLRSERSQSSGGGAGWCGGARGVWVLVVELGGNIRRRMRRLDVVAGGVDDDDAEVGGDNEDEF